MRTIFRSALFTILLVRSFDFAAADELSAKSIVSHSLQIRRNPTASISDQDAATIIQQGTNVLNQCRAIFAQSGSVQSAAIPSIINSAADMQAACGTSIINSNGGYETLGIPRSVKIVNGINWCGSTGTGIIGCSYTPGICLVMRRFTSSMEGILWAHEFGHSKGLQHRTDSTNAVMYPTIGPSRLEFNSSECSSVRQINFYPQSFSPASSVQMQGVSIEDFVSSSFPEGVPYDVARNYSENDLMKVEPWLSDVSRRSTWGNIVSVIGIVAAPSAFDKLQAFIFRPGTGKIELEDYDARVGAILSMGYVVRGNSSSDALNFLQSHISPPSWSSLTWTAPYHQNSVERDIDLSNAAILGLSLTKSAAALSTLESMLSNDKAGELSEVKNALQQAIIELTR